MKQLKFLALALIVMLLSSCGSSPEKQTEFDPAFIASQLTLLEENTRKVIAESAGEEIIVPRTINEDGSLRLVAGKDWTSGFFPGTLWYMYELTGEQEWKEKAEAYTALLEKEQFNASNHDVGFRMFCSYGNALRLGKDEAYVPILVQSAKTLLTRYYENVGSIKSWDFNEEVWQFPVIIDNMMNLELLFWASEQTGDPLYREIAITHALTTMENQFRADYSTVHVVDYDSITGEVRQKNTHQGYSDESSWARGQAWGLYGFTMTYRCTGDKRFLEQAENIAGFLLNHKNLPEDGIPYWDFNDPAIPDVPRDVSAAAIIASALYELSTYSVQSDLFRSEADRIMDNIWLGYRSGEGENYGFILDHATGHLPGGSEIDVPLNYADYYFLEAQLRRNNL